LWIRHLLAFFLVRGLLFCSACVDVLRVCLVIHSSCLAPYRSACPLGWGTLREAWWGHQLSGVGGDWLAARRATRRHTAHPTFCARITTTHKTTLSPPVAPLCPATRSAITQLSLRLSPTYRHTVTVSECAVSEFPLNPCPSTICQKEVQTVCPCQPLPSHDC
jgi:hypothetical protein